MSNDDPFPALSSTVFAPGLSFGELSMMDPRVVPATPDEAAEHMLLDALAMDDATVPLGDAPLVPDADADLLMSDVCFGSGDKAIAVKAEPEPLTAAVIVGDGGCDGGRDSSVSPANSGSSDGDDGDDGDDATAIIERLTALFPMHVLRMPRKQFTAWRSANVRLLSSRESKHLTKLRRTILARVYAERTRQRKQSEHKTISAKLVQLQHENDRLRRSLTKLEQEFSHVCAKCAARRHNK